MNDKREGHSARSASKTEVTVGDFCCYVKKRCLWSFFSKWIFFIIIIFKNCHHYFNLWQCYYFQDRLPGLAEPGSYWTGRQRPLINSNMLNLTQNITLLKKSVLECSHLLRLLYKQRPFLLQITLTHRLLQAAHEDNFVSWPVHTFLVAQLCWTLPRNPGCNPKAQFF